VWKAEKMLGKREELWEFCEDCEPDVEMQNSVFPVRMSIEPRSQ
jgi:hypothetical protein